MKKIFLILFALLFLISFTIAAPPVQQNVNTNIGLDIDFPKMEGIKINTDHQFDFHVFNISSGLRLDNTSVTCMFHLFNHSDGTHLISEEGMDFDDVNDDFEITVLGGNFSQVMMYSILVDCNDGGFGGFVSFAFQVTPTGHVLDQPQSLIIFGLILVLIFLSGVFLLFGNKIEYLPFKIFLIALGALFLMFLIGVSVTLINDLLIVGVVLSTTFVNLYRLMLILVSAGGIGLMLYIIYMSVKQFYSHRGLMDKFDD